MNDEEQKRHRREAKAATKKAEKEKREKEELERADAWKASYARRVRTYKELLKQANIEYTLEVDDDLNVSVRINSGYEYVTVDNERQYLNTSESLTIDTEEWEFDSLVRNVADLLSARAKHEEFLFRVRVFKHSLTEDQLKMVKYFNQVF